MNLICRIVSASILFFSVAVPAFPQAAEDQQASFAAHTQKAKEYLDAKRPDLAIPELQAAVAIDPRNVETQANLGVLLYFQGKATDATPHLRAATTVQPDLAKIRGLLGLAEVHTSDIPAGRKDVRPVSLLTKQALIGTVFSDRLGQRKCAPCGIVPFIDLQRATGFLTSL